MLFLLNGSPQKWKKTEAFPNETPNHNVGYADQVFAPPSRSKGQLKSFSAPFSAVEVHGFDFFSVPRREDLYRDSLALSGAENLSSLLQRRLLKFEGGKGKSSIFALLYTTNFVR